MQEKVRRERNIETEMGRERNNENNEENINLNDRKNVKEYLRVKK